MVTGVAKVTEGLLDSSTDFIDWISVRAAEDGDVQGVEMNRSTWVRSCSWDLRISTYCIEVAIVIDLRFSY